MKVVFRIITVLLLLGVFISCFSSYAFHCAIIVFCAFQILRCIFSHVQFVEHLISVGILTGLAVFSVFNLFTAYENGSRIFTAHIEGYETSSYITKGGNTRYSTETKFSYKYKGGVRYGYVSGSVQNIYGNSVIMATPYNMQDHFKVVNDLASDSLCKVYENGVYHVGEFDETLENVTDNQELREKFEASMDNRFFKFFRDYWYLFTIVFAIINALLCSYSHLMGRIAFPLSFMAIAALNYTCHSAAYYLIFHYGLILAAYWATWTFTGKYRVSKEIAKRGGYIVTAYEISTNRFGTNVEYVAPNGKKSKHIISDSIKKNGIILFPFIDDDDYYVIDPKPSTAIMQKFNDGVYIDAVSNINKIPLLDLQPSESMKEKYLAKY